MENQEIRVQLDEQILDVSGKYTPEEAQVRYYPDGSGYPGSPAEFDIQKILWVKETESLDVTDLLLSLGVRVYMKIEELIIYEIEK